VSVARIRGRAVGSAALLLAGACGVPLLPEPAPRVVAVEPSGAGVPVALAAVTVAFSSPVSPEGLTDGRLLVLVPAASERAAVAAVESGDGAADLAGAAPAWIGLADGGRTAVLHLGAPLHALVAYAVVIGSGVRDVDGRPVLDAAGRTKPTVARFETGPAPGPPARPVLAELRIDAETPEAGGEYVVLQNRGAGGLDLFGHRLEKRSASGAVTACALGEGVVAPGKLALLVGGAYDGRYLLPQGTLVVTCGTSSLLGGLANDRFPALQLRDPRAAILTTAGAAGGPVCAVAVRTDLDGPDEPWNWQCVEAE
jgi:hypothetical protein